MSTEQFLIGCIISFLIGREVADFLLRREEHKAAISSADAQYSLDKKIVDLLGDDGKQIAAIHKRLDNLEYKIGEIKR